MNKENFLKETCKSCGFNGIIYEFIISNPQYYFISQLRLGVIRKAIAKCPKCKNNFKINL